MSVAIKRLVYKVILYICFIEIAILIGSEQAKAGTKLSVQDGKKNNSVTICGGNDSTGGKAIGRYSLNYTGNINFSADWQVVLDTEGVHYPCGYAEASCAVYNDYGLKNYSTKSTYQNGKTQKYYKYTATYNAIANGKDFSGDEYKYIYNPAKEITANSSKATLTKGADDATIAKAYLIWNTRDSGGLFGFYDDPVQFKTPGSSSWQEVYPDYACADNRYGIQSYLCMAADVTDIVKEAGYGEYGVANIPFWYQTPSDTSNHDGAQITGGYSYGAWQLVIIEQSATYSVKAVKLNIGYTYKETDIEEEIKIGNYVYTKSTGAIAQIFSSATFGELDSSAKVTIKTDNGKESTIKYKGGYFYKYGEYVNYNTDGSPRIESGIAVALKQASGITGMQNKFKAIMSRDREYWDSFGCLGIAFTIEAPEFGGAQNTTCDENTNTVTVTGGYTNITSYSEKTGIVDGKLTVTLDSELTANSGGSTLKVTYVDGKTKNIAGVVSGNTVTFNGIDLKNKGDKCEYTVVCSITSIVDNVYYNEDELSGKFYSNGEKVNNYDIFKVSKSKSSYTRGVVITLDNQASAVDGNPNGLISAGTASYFEKYGVANYTDAYCTAEISIIEKPVKEGCQFGGYYTKQDGAGKREIDASGNILHDSKEFKENTTLYAYWMPGVPAVIDHDTNNLLYCVKYRVGFYKQRALSNGIYTVNENDKISSIVTPTKTGYEFKGYFTEENGKGTQYVDEDGTILNNSIYIKQDTYVYAYYVPKEYKITCDWQGGSGVNVTEYFYELYDNYFTFNAIKKLDSTVTKNYSYSGSKASFTAPYTGWYYLQVYGAQGSNEHSTGGKGGYAYGCVKLSQNETVYIYVGGKGTGSTGGWNGGASGGSYINWWHVGGGGGATDIRRGGEANGDRIIVAGGGGGSGKATFTKSGKPIYATGGSGSGNTTFEPFYVLKGSADGFSGKVLSNTVTNLPRTTKKAGTATGIGGGGGYYGGYAGTNSKYVSVGEGGSGYIGGVKTGTICGTKYSAGSEAGKRSGNGKAVIIYADYEIKEGTKTTSIYAPVKSGKEFKGYYTKKNGKGTQVVNSEGVIMVAPNFWNSDATIYACWEDSVSTTEEQEFYVQFNGNGADNGIMDSMTISIDGDTSTGANLNGNKYSKTGYKFDGWATSANGAVVIADKGLITEYSPVTVSNHQIVTLYAKWKPLEYKIVYDGNTGINNRYGDAYSTGVTGKTEDTNCKYDTTFITSICRFERKGYWFLGWNTSSDGNGTWVGYGTNGAVVINNPVGVSFGSMYSNWSNLDGDILTLYAIWEPNKYNIAYNSNDDDLGDWNDTDIVKQTRIRVDQTVALLQNIFSRKAPIVLNNGVELTEGYNFIGWSNTSTDTTATYNDGEQVKNLSYVNNATANLYALWSKPIELRLNPNPKHPGAKINNKTSVTVFSATVYNDTYAYTFDISNYYGSYNNNGVNNINTYLDSSGIEHRFLGWSHDNYDNIPYEAPESSSFDVYSSSRINNYTIYDNNTLYAMWEPVLKLTATLGRTLDGVTETAYADAITAGTINSITAKTSDRIEYNYTTTGYAKNTSVDVDTMFTEVYRLAKSDSAYGKYWDDYNVAVLDSQYNINDTQVYTDGALTHSLRNAFYIPQYILGYQEEKYGYVKYRNYTVEIVATNDTSYYWTRHMGQNETAIITCTIGINKINDSDEEHKDIKYSLRYRE